MSTSIGSLLKYYRESMSLTQVQVASYINSNLYSEDEKKINQSTINKIEKGNKVPTDILKFLQNHFFLFNIDDSLDIFTTAKEVSDLLRIDYDNDDEENLDLEQLFTLRTKDQIIDYLNRFYEHKDEPRRSRFHIEEERSLENMLRFYPKEIFVDYYHYREHPLGPLLDVDDGKGDINTLASFVLFVAFNYIIKYTNAEFSENRKNTTILKYKLKTIDSVIHKEEEFLNFFVCMTDANNWDECTDAAKGKYLVSYAKKELLFHSFDKFFPKFCSQLKRIPNKLIDMLAEADDNKYILSDITKPNLEKDNRLTTEKGLTSTTIKQIKQFVDNPLKVLLGYFTYYQHYYLPTKTDVNILIKRYQNARWINDISFIDFTSLKKELTNIKERVPAKDKSKKAIEDYINASEKYRQLSDLYNKLEQYVK